MKALLAAFAMASLALAGCSGGGGNGGGPGTEPLPADKGAISGLLINDVYRPVPDGLVLLQPAGLTATSDASGQFAFDDLEPGAYILRVQAEGHEAAPINVDVKAGEYTESEVIARRVFSEGTRILTTEYSVFIPCAVSAPIVTATEDCTFDQSGDSYRAVFYSNFTEGYEGITYLVTEMKASKPASTASGAYKVVVREEGDGDYWASWFTVDGDYIRIVNRIDNVSEFDTEARNVAWENDKPMETALFPQGAFKAETQQVFDAECSVDPVGVLCGESRGLGPQIGVRAKFVQSLFLGEPEVDITTYCVLC